MEPRRITSTRLLTEAGRIHRGDVLLHSDGSWSESNGDEDVIETIDGSNRVITRSFQNWHTHLPMILNRSMGEGLPLMEWLQASIFPTEQHVTKELIEVGTRAAVAELIATGTTFACDMYHYPDAIAPVIEESGIRGIVCGPTTDWPPSSEELSDSGEALKNLERLLSGEPLADGRVRYGIAAHAVYTCSEDTLLRAAELGRRYSAPVHIHTSETRQEVANCHSEHGMYPVEYLDSIGFLEEGTVCAHCGWVTKKEMRILAEKKCHAVHCPISNQKLACGGTMSYPAMKEANVDVRLGTDGAASNNSLDMRAEAKAASLIQRHDHWDARILDPVETWQLATKGSQDWITWDLNDVRLRPTGRDDRRLLANLIYSGGRVLDVFVDGHAIRRDGITLSIDEIAAIEALEIGAREYYSNI
ncbi:MAG: chlorohydrolase [Euryarchaeota archaeon]|jgi:5-methylthioadenosine/S-adenosylhomocysteine deaminase|nr:chlorohydrolase [Euryarchaeota archaeon]